MEQIKPRIRVFTRSQQSMKSFNQNHTTVLSRWAQDRSLTAGHKINQSASGQVNHFYNYREL